MKYTINKNVVKLLKFMDSKHKIKEIYSKQNENEFIQSTSSDELILLYFTIILDYYYEQGTIPVQTVKYYDISIEDNTRVVLIKDIFPKCTENFAINIFNKIDLMYDIIKTVLHRVQSGFKNNKECNVTLSDTSLFLNLDLLFYIVFYSTLPNQLNRILADKLHIMSDVEKKILEKCSEYIKDNKICTKVINISLDELSDKLKCKKTVLSSIAKMSPTHFDEKFIDLKTPSGIFILIKIFTDLRSFHNKMLLQKKFQLD